MTSAWLQLLIQFSAWTAKDASCTCLWKGDGTQFALILFIATLLFPFTSSVDYSYWKATYLFRSCVFMRVLYHKMINSMIVSSCSPSCLFTIAPFPFVYKTCYWLDAMDINPPSFLSIARLPFSHLNNFLLFISLHFALIFAEFSVS